MKPLICFGEAIVDLLSNRIGASNSTEETFTKYAGGAPANVAVAAAKLGTPAYFCGMLGDDSFGHFLHDSLREHGVNTDYVRFTSAAKTALAFVSLDDKGERSFEFYRPPAADLCFTANDFDPSWFHPQGVFHICSNSMTEQGINQATQYGLELAEKNQWLISFDVNLRENLWPDTSEAKPRIEAALRKAHVVKMAVEELAFLCANDDEQAYIDGLLSHTPQLLLVTDGGRPLKWYSKSQQGEVIPPSVSMVDATAAGDAFVGGLLSQLCEREGPLPQLIDDASRLDDVLMFACKSGGFAAAHKGAFPALPNRQRLASFFKEQ